MLLDSESKKWLADHYGAGIKFDEPMSKHTSLQVGGPAEAYFVPGNIEALKSLINWAWHKEIPYLIIGDGTNLLVKDSGIKGIVIALTKCLQAIAKTDNDKEEVVVTAMAGVRMQALCRFALEHGLAGLNFALGIPGTVGGGIMMNAGTADVWIENVLKAVTVLLPNGQIQQIARNRLNFSYRNLALNMDLNQEFQAYPVIIDGSFGLHRKDPVKLKAEAQKILRRRMQTQPISYPSAGCFFKNPGQGKTAGQLIDLAGLKGKAIGGAEVSPKHANFFINTGQATASNFLALMELVHDTVLKMFNIDLESEVKIVGA